jgi:alpha-beta hydrolase superfamily lysophospholipase
VRADPDPRIRAVLAISPAEPRDPAHWSSRRILQRVTAPGLHLTGTEDHSKLGFTAPEGRRTAYDAIGAGQQHLLVLDGVRHETFAAEPSLSRCGRRSPRAGRSRPPSGTRSCAGTPPRPTG